MKKIDRGTHHKLVLKNSNKLLARYVHNPWSMDVAGTIDVFEEVPGIDPKHCEPFVIVRARWLLRRRL
jgi:hypothetical protein